MQEAFSQFHEEEKLAFRSIVAALRITVPDATHVGCNELVVVAYDFVSVMQLVLAEFDGFSIAQKHAFKAFVANL